MVLGKLSVLRHPTYLDISRAKAYCTLSRCRWGLFGLIFLSSIISLFLSPSVWEEPLSSDQSNSIIVQSP